jgi:hypothetical protein
MKKRKTEPDYLSETCMTPWKWNDGDCDDCEECNHCKMYIEHTDRIEGRKDENKS